MKLQFAYETETSVNDNGYYAITQTDEFGEESVVILTREQCKLMQEDLIGALNAEDWYNRYD